MFLSGKKGIICGITNNKSIGYGIAKVLKSYGANLGFIYQNESILKRSEDIINDLGSDFLIECDVSNQDSIKNLFDTAENIWGNIDFLVHSIAFADKNELRGMYVNTTKDNFLNSIDISCYSFTSMLHHCKRLMKNGGSALTLSYYGAEKVMPNYNVMGVCKAALESSVRYSAADLGRHNIRVNAISAGPIKTIAANGIEKFSNILKYNIANAPLKRSVTLEDIGKAALFLLSDLSSGVTGEILHVDAGYNVIGMCYDNYENEN